MLITWESDPIHRRSLNFASDILADGRWFWALCVNDDVTWERLAPEADRLPTGEWAERELDAIVACHSKRQHVVSDNGTEPIFKAIPKWRERNKLD